MHAQVAIIGAGPIGIELAVSLKRAGLRLLHFDARQIGHTISWFAPQTRFFSSNDRIAIAGVPLQTADQSKASREEYLAYLRCVVEQFDLEIKTFEPVVGIERKENSFSLKTNRQSYEVEKIVLATGGTERPRKLNIPGEDLPHVSAYFQDPHTYFRKRLLIIGGRNSAVEAAIRCHRAGAQVAVNYRRDAFDSKSIKYWLMPEITGLFEAEKIEGHFNSVPVEIKPDQVVLRRANGETFSVQSDFVLLLIGYEADMTLCRLAGVHLDGPGEVPVFDPSTMETTVPGIYVAGTAIAGTQQRYKVFIENCHSHVSRITAALTHHAPPTDAPPERSAEKLES